MNELARKKCKPCEGGVAPLTPEQVRPMLKGLQGWSLDRKMIAKTYQHLSQSPDYLREALKRAAG